MMPTPFEQAVALADSLYGHSHRQWVVWVEPRVLAQLIDEVLHTHFSVDWMVCREDPALCIDQRVHFWSRETA